MFIRDSAGHRPFHQNMICVVCRDPITDAAKLCAGCGASTHSECAPGTCPTIGCQGQVAEPAPDDEMIKRYRVLSQKVTFWHAIAGLIMMISFFPASWVVYKLHFTQISSDSEYKLLWTINLFSGPGSLFIYLVCMAMAWLKFYGMQTIADRLVDHYDKMRKSSSSSIARKDEPENP